MRPAMIVATLLVPLALAGSAGAQSYGAQGYGQPGSGAADRAQAPPRPDDRYDRDTAERPERPERPEAAEQGAASDELVRQLNLRGDQQAAFRDYQAAFQASGDAGDGQDDVGRLAAMTTPQRLDDSARQMDRDRADFERVAAATRRFYATLDSGQKRTFDRLTAPQAEPEDDGGPGAAEGRTPSRPPVPQR